MKFRYYLLAAIVLAVASGAFVYSLSGENYELALPFSERVLSLPVAVWFVVPLLVFFCLVAFFELFGKIARFLRFSRYKKDNKLILKQIRAQLLGNELNEAPHTERYKIISDILKNLELNIKQDLEMPIPCGNTDFDELLGQLFLVKNGKVANLPKDAKNKASAQNVLNKIENDEKFALNILKDKNANEEHKRAAFAKLLESSEYEKDLAKFVHSVKFDRKLADNALGACCARRLNFAPSDVAKLCSAVGYSAADFVRLAQRTKNCYQSPDEWLEFFKELANLEESAALAHFFVLLDLEMIEQARELLGNFAQNEMLLVRAYLELRDSGKRYPLELFIL